MVTAPGKLVGGCIAALVLLACGPAMPAKCEVADWFAPRAADAELTRLPALDNPSAGEMVATEPFLTEPRWKAPRLSARLGAVLLQRARPRSDVVLTELVTGRTLINTDDLVFPFQGGVDAGLLWHGTVADVEFRYFGVEQWNASPKPVFTTIGAQLHIPDEDPFFGPLGARIFGSSSLHSFELNVRRNVAPRWTWLAGLRYVAFRDSMGLMSGDPTFTDFGRVVFGTTNRLFGLQIGADGILWQGDRFRVESAIKAGVFANGIDLSLNGADTTGDSFSFRTDCDHTAFVGDLNFVGVYQLDERWALRAGYQLLWLSGVAAGSAQLGGFLPDGFAIDTSATVFFHGALLGVERNW